MSVLFSIIALRSHTVQWDCPHPMLSTAFHIECQHLSQTSFEIRATLEIYTHRTIIYVPSIVSVFTGAECNISANNCVTLPCGPSSHNLTCSGNIIIFLMFFFCTDQRHFRPHPTSLWWIWQYWTSSWWPRHLSSFTIHSIGDL